MPPFRGWAHGWRGPHGGGWAGPQRLLEPQAVAKFVAWLAAWEAHTARDGLEGGAAYWDAGWRWIADQRERRARPSLEIRVERNGSGGREPAVY